MNRRGFCKSMLAFAGITNLPACNLLKDKQFASAFNTFGNKHFIAKLDENGAIVTQVEIPYRGHDLAQVPNQKNRVFAFARRPGNMIFDINLEEGTLTNTIESQKGRHFYGHGVFSLDGQFLFTPENDFENQVGKIVVRNVNDSSVLAEYDSGGVGPHQCALLSDGITLVIANGGIATHPNQPRKKLNIASMKPNLTYLNTQTGEVKAQILPPHDQLSIRHLDVSKQDKVVVGMQYQGNKQDKVPLIFTQQGDNALQACEVEQEVWQQMNQYTASVCIDNALNIAAVSAPRGNLVSYWDLNNNKYLGQYHSADCAGVALADDGFVLSNGTGVIERIVALSKTPLKQKRSAGIKWDNHMLALV
ncbi:DUF1513 domain-containing protein [Pseudoalteromonas denitrificans]|uniref:DUF1513 domain-containing protein n=1 Tax=Pseudoalteromonas denitrificans DSM 6059 TaxID=1123010 RepID=A0A1I1E7F9_9GAMM|nr:DUF1513 domain-containing protein [Pseudoalteromonas denitrificans]SFB83004.1 hypothetical protein SAMN02745724_00258 [Pseudoalteromonas denitrificans DSM 6059]